MKVYTMQVTVKVKVLLDIQLLPDRIFIFEVVVDAVLVAGANSSIERMMQTFALLEGGIDQAALSL